jgi:hypothetical protein
MAILWCRICSTAAATTTTFIRFVCGAYCCAPKANASDCCHQSLQLLYVDFTSPAERTAVLNHIAREARQYLGHRRSSVVSHPGAPKNLLKSVRTINDLADLRRCAGRPRMGTDMHSALLASLVARL